MSKFNKKIREFDFLWHLNYADQGSKVANHIYRASMAYYQTDEFLNMSRREQDQYFFMICDLMYFLHDVEIIRRAQLYRSADEGSR